MNPLLKLFSRICFDDYTYCYIRLLVKFKRLPHLKHPLTFNEKINWLKLYDKNPKYTQMVDKVTAKEYVASIIGEEYIIPTLGIWEKVEDINFEELPNQFVLKCSHDSGGIVICKDKSKFNIDEAKEKMNKCLHDNFFHASREYPYKNIKPRILAEVYIKDRNRPELLDYKLMLFNGKVHYTFVCSEREKKHELKIDFFDNNWIHQPFERKYPNSNKAISAPKGFEQMKNLAETLAQDINNSFVRIDFYEIDGKIYFGEITFYPGSGLEPFNPDSWDYKLGSLIDLPKRTI